MPVSRKIMTQMIFSEKQDDMYCWRGLNKVASAKGICISNASQGAL